MKKQDFLFIFVLVIIFLPFFVSESIYDWYKSFNAAHGMVMSFIKFGILATLGEMLGLRISAGVYNRKGFGVLPRAIVWGLLGMGINAAMIIFSKGVPQFMEYMGMANAAAIINGEFCLDKLWIALAISVAMNTIFAPVFMTFHKITDTHILDCGGSPRSLLTPIPDDPHHYASELGCTMEFCLQENNFFLLVSGTHHHIPPAGRNAGAVCSDIGCGARGIAGYCGSDEIIRPIYSRMISSKSCG